MAFSIKDLRELPIEEVISRHDDLAKNTVVGTRYFLEELDCRDRNAQTESMLKYTRYIVVMTAVMTIATIVNVVLFIIG